MPPQALDRGIQAEMRNGVGIASPGGILVSRALTLIATPRSGWQDSLLAHGALRAQKRTASLVCQAAEQTKQREKHENRHCDPKSCLGKG